MNRVAAFLILSFFLVTFFVSCTKEFSSENGKVILPANGAVFSLKNSSGNCEFSLVHGTYFAGVAAKDSNFLELAVIVTTVGSYRLSSDTQNGFFFSDSGTFSNTGLNRIILKAGGTPILPLNTTFTIKGTDSSSTACTFTVNVIDNNTWQFSQGMSFYHGFVDTAYTFDTTIASVSFTILNLVGTVPTGDSLFTIGLAFPGTGNISPGTYSSLNLAQFAFLDPNSNFIFEADPTTTTVETKVTIISYDATTKILVGEFSGFAKAGSGSVSISGGKFNARLK
ncbi:MAG TPA: hypothetical protein VGZ71_09095 [Puia sp.]|jgi:hypothetical protein|nr:hypothetical protein [Puia sp.]